MISDTASSSTGRHTFPLSPSYSTDSSATGTSSSTGRGAPNSEATSDEQPDLGAFTTVLRAWTHLQPAPRVPIGLSSGSTISVASTGAGTRPSAIQDRDSRSGYSYSDAGQSSISSFTHPHLSSAAVSVTDDGGAAEDRHTTVWDHRPIWSSYLRSDSAMSKPDSPTDSESEARTVEITSDMENDSRSIPDSFDSHSDSHPHLYSQSHNPIPVSIQPPFALVPQALSSLSSLDLNDSFSSSQFSQRTLRRSNFPIQNDFSAAGSLRMHSQSSSPSYHNHHQQDMPPRHSYLPSQFQDSEAAVRSLLEEASRSRHHGVVNDVSSIASSSRGRPTPESAYSRSDQGSSYSQSLQTQASGYIGTPTSTASEVVLAPHAYPQYQRQTSNLRNYSPSVEVEPFSPLPTPTDASEIFPYDGRPNQDHEYDVRTPTRTLGTGSSQTYDGAHSYPHPLVGLHVLPTTLPGNGPSGPPFDARRGSSHTETWVQKEILPTKEEDTDSEKIKYRRRPASDATTISEQIVLSPPFPPSQAKTDYVTPDSSASVTITRASRNGDPPSNFFQPSTTIGYDQPSTTIGYNPTAAEVEHPTLGALDEALSFIALERARMAALKKPVYDIPAGDLSSEGEGHGARRVQVESGGSGGPSKMSMAGSGRKDDDNAGTSPNAVTTITGAGSSSGKRKRRRKKAAAAAAALSPSLTNNSEVTLDQHLKAAGSSRLSKSSSTSTITGGSSSGTGSSLGPGRPLLLAPKIDRAPTPLKTSMVETTVEEGDWEDEEEQDLLRTPKALPRFKSLSKPSIKDVPKVTKDKTSREKEKIKPGGITILARPKATPTSAISDVSVTSNIQQQQMKLRTRPVVEAEGEDDEWEGVDSGSSKEPQGNAGGQLNAVEEKKGVDIKGGFSLAGKQGRRIGRREREKEKRRLDALLGAPSITDRGAFMTSDDNDDSAGDVYDDDPEDDISPNLAKKFNNKQAADKERTSDLYSSEGGEILSAGLRAWHLQRGSRTLGPSSLGSELGREVTGAGTGSRSRTPRPTDNAPIDQLEAGEILMLDDASATVGNGTGTPATGQKKKKRSRRARTLLARSKSYPNLRAAAELGTQSLKKRLGFLGSGSNAGSGVLEFEADLYLDQNKRNRLYILAHKLLATFPEQKRDLKRVILKLEQSTLNGATSSSSTKRKGHKKSTSITSGGYGSGAGVGIGTMPSMASFSNPDYIDYDEPQDPAEFDVQGPAHTPGASIVHVFIDHSNILIGLLNYLRRHPPPQSTVDEYVTSRMRHTSHSTPALIDVDADGEISIPGYGNDEPSAPPRSQNGSNPIPIPAKGKGKGKMPIIETPTASVEDYPIPLPSFATARSKGASKPHSNAQASLVALSKSLPTESFLSQGQSSAVDEGVSDSNEEGSRSDGRLKKATAPKFPRHIWHAALALILERGRPVSRRVVVTSSPLHQPMEKIMRLGYEVRVFIRVPDLGDGMDRREKENRFSNSNNSSGAGKSNTSQTSHPKAGGTSSSPAAKGFVYGAVSAAGASGGSPSGSFMGASNAGSGTPAKKGHARHLSGYTSNESGSGSNRDNKGIGVPPSGPPAKVRYREQGVDELLQLKLHQALADVDNVPKGSTIVLATGDGNVGQFNEDGFLGPVRLALRKGWKVELYAWEDGLSKSWRREFGEGSEYGQKGLFRIIPLEQFGTSLVEAAGW